MSDRPPIREDGPDAAKATKPIIAEVAAWLRRAAGDRVELENRTTAAEPEEGPAAPTPADATPQHPDLVHPELEHPEAAPTDTAQPEATQPAADHPPSGHSEHTDHQAEPDPPDEADEAKGGQDTGPAHLAQVPRQPDPAPEHLHPEAPAPLVEPPAYVDAVAGVSTAPDEAPPQAGQAPDPPDRQLDEDMGASEPGDAASPTAAEPVDPPGHPGLPERPELGAPQPASETASADAVVVGDSGQRSWILPATDQAEVLSVAPSSEAPGARSPADASSVPEREATETGLPDEAGPSAAPSDEPQVVGPPPESDLASPPPLEPLPEQEDGAAASPIHRSDDAAGASGGARPPVVPEAFGTDAIDIPISTETTGTQTADTPISTETTGTQTADTPINTETVDARVHLAPADRPDVPDVGWPQPQWDLGPTVDPTPRGSTGAEPVSEVRSAPDRTHQADPFDLDLAEMADRARASAAVSAKATSPSIEDDVDTDANAAVRDQVAGKGADELVGNHIGGSDVSSRVNQAVQAPVELEPVPVDLEIPAAAAATTKTATEAQTEWDEWDVDDQPADDVIVAHEARKAPRRKRPPRPGAGSKRTSYPRGQLKERIGILQRIRAMLGVVVVTVLLGVAAGAAIGAFLLFIALAVRSAITSS